MSAPQFFVRRLVEGERVSLDPDDARHAAGSLRLRVGDEVRLADGDGGVGRGVLVKADRGGAVLEVADVGHVARPAPTVSVALAPPKGDRLSWAVQKLAEVGVDEVILVETERSVRRWNAERASSAAQRLTGVAREAAMQSRRPFVTRISGPRSLSEAAAGMARAVVLWERAEEGLGAVLEAGAGDVRLVVGPEGGFAETEVLACVEKGAVAASLGKGILRTETAALAASVVALQHLGRLG
jgi:16S rRNA (uracil1498-N3)-methyltransferase